MTTTTRKRATKKKRRRKKNSSALPVLAVVAIVLSGAAAGFAVYRSRTVQSGASAGDVREVLKSMPADVYALAVVADVNGYTSQLKQTAVGSLLFDETVHDKVKAVLSELGDGDAQAELDAGMKKVGGVFSEIAGLGIRSVGAGVSRSRGMRRRRSAWPSP